MSYTNEFSDLCAAFDRPWNKRIPVSWPNVNFTVPSPAEPWCRFTILNGDASRMSIGAPGLNRTVHPGRVVVQVFVPRGRGEVLARRYADDAAAIFRTLKLSNYRFFPPAVAQVSSTVNDDWYQVNMTCPFQRDEYNG